MVAPDPRPPGRVRDPELLRILHLRWRTCALCGSTGFSIVGQYIGMSLHHISKHPRDDVEANLVMLCGDGTRGCHGRCEARDPITLAELRVYILESRPDTLAYLDEKFPHEGAVYWLRRGLGS